MSEYQINQDIISENESKKPDAYNVFCFIVCSTEQEIKNHIGKDLFEYIEPNRYDNEDNKKWKPFSEEGNIEEILNEFMNTKGYNFEINFLNGEQPSEIFVVIDNNKNNSFAIIDLLSINESNALTVQRFDTKDLKGLLMPYCRGLHCDLKKFMDSKRNQYLKTQEYYSQSTPMSLYVYEISAKQSFFQHLTHLFYNNFRIKNTICVDSPVRNLNITLR